MRSTPTSLERQVARWPNEGFVKALWRKLFDLFNQDCPNLCDLETLFALDIL